MGPLALTETEVDQVGQFVGDLAGTLAMAAIATLAVGIATFAFVRATRRWKDDDRLWPKATKVAILGTFFVSGALEWSSTRPAGYQHSHLNSLVFGAIAIATLLVPFFLVAWATAAAIKGRSRHTTAAATERLRERSRR